MSVFKICRTCDRVGVIAEANQNCDTTDHPSPASTKAETQPLVSGRAGKLDPASHVIANIAILLSSRHQYGDDSETFDRPKESKNSLGCYLS